MDSPAALAQAFKYKAAVLKSTLEPYLSPELQLGAMILDSMKPEFLVVGFYEHVVVPHEDRIKAKDADFFLSDASGTDPTLLTLKSAWGKLPEQHRDEVWALLPLLTGISKRYVKIVADGAQA